jgi:hypothetical protein
MRIDDGADNPLFFHPLIHTTIFLTCIIEGSNTTTVHVYEFDHEQYSNLHTFEVPSDPQTKRTYPDRRLVHVNRRINSYGLWGLAVVVYPCLAPDLMWTKLALVCFDTLTRRFSVQHYILPLSIPYSMIPRQMVWWDNQMAVWNYQVTALSTSSFLTFNSTSSTTSPQGLDVGCKPRLDIPFYCGRLKLLKDMLVRVRNTWDTRKVLEAANRPRVVEEILSSPDLQYCLDHASEDVDQLPPLGDTCPFIWADANYIVLIHPYGYIVWSFEHQMAEFRM